LYSVIPSNSEADAELDENLNGHLMTSYIRNIGAKNIKIC